MKKLLMFLLVGICLIGFAVGGVMFKSMFSFLIITFFVMGLLLLCFLREKRLNSDDFCLNSMIGKEVFGSDGNRIGAIENLMLSGDKIYGWVIKADKKYKFEKNILVRYVNVLAIGDVIIVSGNIKKLKSQSL